MTDADETAYVPPEAPSFLHATGAKAWTRLCTELELVEIDDLALLERIGGSLDREAQARRAIRDEGAYLADRFGRKYAHPALAVERASRQAAATMLGQLRRSLLDSQKMELALAREVRLRTKDANKAAKEGRRGGRARHHG
jgi:phage terminase small subunit